MRRRPRGKNARTLEENIAEKRGGDWAGAGWEKAGGGGEGRGAIRASFTKEETDALDEGRKTEREELNKDAAKSKAAKKGFRSSEAVNDFTRDINFSLKLARQDSPRRRRPGGRLASKRHERGVGMAGRKRSGGRRRSEKEGGSGDGRRKVPWRNSLRVSVARYRQRRPPSPWWRKRRSPFSRSNYGGRSDSHLRALYHRPS